MNCQKCKSQRILSVHAKCNDLCLVSILYKEGHHGYVPNDLNIGSIDYIRFEVCLDCGQQQGKWPLPKSELESDSNELSE